MKNHMSSQVQHHRDLLQNTKNVNKLKVGNIWEKPNKHAICLLLVYWNVLYVFHMRYFYHSIEVLASRNLTSACTGIEPGMLWHTLQRSTTAWLTLCCCSS